MIAQELNLRERIKGATKCSLILKGDNGERWYITNTLFNYLLKNQHTEIIFTHIPEHYARTKDGSEKYVPGMIWIEAYVPRRF